MSCTFGARESGKSFPVATTTSIQADQPSVYFESFDSYKCLDAELLPVLSGRRFSTVHEVSEVVSEISLDAVQDVRYWPVSAIQRGLITREQRGRFGLSAEGRVVLKHSA